MEERIIYTVINDLLKEHNINAIWEETNTRDLDGVLTINYKGHTQKFNVEIKKEFRNFQLDQIFKLAENYFPLLVIAETLFPNIKDVLREHGIAYLDLNGNMNIETENFLLKVDGKHQKHLYPEKFGRAFTKAGLKAILVFLLNEDKLNDTYRKIAKNSLVRI